MSILLKIIEKLKRIFGASNINRKNIIIRSSNLSGNVVLNENVKIVSGVNIAAISKVEIGKYTTIVGPNSHINNYINEIKIGNFCSIAPGVIIQEYNHHIDKLSTYYINKNILKLGSRNDVTSKGKITIGHDVWIGSNSIILSGVAIGNGAIIGANSVVTKDIPEFSIYGGNPAKFIKKRFSEDVISYINNLQWWYWDAEKIKKNHKLFTEKIINNMDIDIK